MDWIVGISAFIAVVVSVSALLRIGNMQTQIMKKFDLTLRSALGALKTDSDENAQLLKRISSRILELEKRVSRQQHSEANKKAEISKLRKENQRLKSVQGKRGAARRKSVK